MTSLEVSILIGAWIMAGAWIIVRAVNRSKDAVMRHMTAEANRVVHAASIYCDHTVKALSLPQDWRFDPLASTSQSSSPSVVMSTSPVTVLSSRSGPPMAVDGWVKSVHETTHGL